MTDATATNWLTAIPLPVLWICGGAALFLVGTLCFIAGYLMARHQDRRLHHASRASIAALFRTTLSALDTAREVCALLERYPGQIISPAQLSDLESKQTNLLDVLGRLIGRHASGRSGSAAATDAESQPVPEFDASSIQWLKEPVHPVTGLPDRSAFESNLASLLELGRNVDVSSMLLLIRVDKLAGMRSRLGPSAADTLYKKLSGVVCRSVRDCDFVACFAPATLAVLIPGLSGDVGQRAARTIRDSVRSYHFHVDDTSPEVLLTASYGLTTCHPGDNRDLVVNHALDALVKSERLGRNQLHLHDGAALVHCAVE